MVQEEGAVQQVDADHAESFLLQAGLAVEQAHVHDDLALLVARVALELEAHPAVAFLGAVKTLGRHRVGEDEERRGVTARGGQALHVLLVLVVEHALQAVARDVALGVAVDGVADRHVVGRHALGNGPGGPPHPEKPAGDFLARADLGKSAVASLVQVDGQGLAMRVQNFVVGQVACEHGWPLAQRLCNH